jgi:hypothetical protein
LRLLAEAETSEGAGASEEQQQVGESQSRQWHAKAAAICRELYLQDNHFLVKVPIVLDMPKAKRLVQMLPPGILQFCEDPGASGGADPSELPAPAEVPGPGVSTPKAKRFLRSACVVRYIGVRWLCRQLLQRHPQLRDAYSRLVEDTLAKRAEEALEPGTDYALMDFVRRYGWTDIGHDLSFLLARRYMESGEITRALALFKLLAGRREVGAFIAACVALHDKRVAWPPQGRHGSADGRGQTEMKTMLSDGFQVFHDRDAGTVWKLCRMSDVASVGRSLVGTVLTAENDLVHYVVCLRGGDENRCAEPPCVEWAIPLCWQRLQTEDGLLLAESRVLETQRCIDVLNSALTPPAVTADGQVIVQTGHGIIAAVDIVFGFPTWLVCYALDTPPSDEVEGKSAPSPFIQRYHWPRSWAPAAPVTSEGCGKTVVAAAPLDSSQAYILRADDGLPLTVVESWQGNRFEFSWLTTDETGFIFFTGTSVLALDVGTRAGARGGGQVETFPLPEDAVGRGCALGGSLFLPTTRGLYKVVFGVPRPRTTCLEEWRLADDVLLDTFLEPDNSILLTSSDGKFRRRVLIEERRAAERPENK